MNRSRTCTRTSNAARLLFAALLFLLLICSCTSSSEEPRSPTLQDYIGTWAYSDDDGSYSLSINSDASCALATMHTGYSTSTSSGSVSVNGDGSAEFIMENSVGYSYSYSSGIETLTIGSFTLSRTSGTVGTIVGTWGYNGVSDTVVITFSSDATISGTQNSYSFTGTWNASSIHARIMAYNMSIDLSVNPNTIHLSNTDFDMVLARQ
jgi:hypothetical protein